METTPIATIPWHYLGVIRCLTSGRSVVANETVRNLHDELSALTGTPFKTALQATQDPGDASTGLVARAFSLSSAAGKPGYAWNLADWDLPVAIRYIAPDMSLSPSGIVVPWPWDKPTGVSLANRRATEFSSETSDDVGDPVYAHEHGMPLSAFMDAVEYALINQDGRASFESERADPIRAKRWLIDRANQPINQPIGTYPASLRILVEDDRLTTATTWEVYPNHLRLVMGWATVDGADGTGKSINLNEWPCGALTTLT